jgi:hypothetical protein
LILLEGNSFLPEECTPQLYQASEANGVGKGMDDRDPGDNQRHADDGRCIRNFSKNGDSDERYKDDANA